MPSHVLANWSRYLGALALLGVGLDHLEQYSVDSYSVIPTIGTLFALNFASAALLAAGLAAPVQRLPGHAGRLAVPVLGLAGIGVAAGSVVGLLLSERTGLFGFMETGYRPAIVLSIGLEATTVALLGVHLALRRPHGPRAERCDGRDPLPDCDGAGAARPDGGRCDVRVGDGLDPHGRPALPDGDIAAAAIAPRAAAPELTMLSASELALLVDWLDRVPDSPGGCSWSTPRGGRDGVRPRRRLRPGSR